MGQKFEMKTNIYLLYSLNTKFKKDLNPCKHFNKEEHGGRQWKKSSTRGRVLQTSVASEGETIDFQIRKTKQSVKCKG